MKGLAAAAKEIGSLDLRALAAQRVAIALVLLADLALRAPHIRAHYTDEGVLPREALRELIAYPWRWSLHSLGGSSGFEALLFAVALVAGLALLLGYRTRLATFASWLLLISLHTRNPMLLTGGDTELRMILFWGLFLPWGSRGSVDGALARRRGTEPTSRVVSALACRAYTLQIVSVYLFSVLLKSGADWQTDHTAIYYAMSIDQMATTLGRWLLDWPEVLAALVPVVLATEAIAPLLLVVPQRWPWPRLAGMVALAGMHATFILTMNLGIFPWLCGAALLGFLPGRLLDGLSPVVDRWLARDSIARRLDRLVTRIDRSDPRIGPLSGGSWAEPATLALLGCSMLYVLQWNLGTIDPAWRVPRSLRWYSQVARLDQEWDMFAPRPYRDDGWFVLPGVLRDGTPVDARTGGPVVWEKPDSVSDSLGYYRWRKYLRRIWMKRNKRHRLYYGRYLCRESKRAAHPETDLETFEIFYMLEWTPAPGEPSREVERRQIWRHRCGLRSKGTL